MRVGVADGFTHTPLVTVRKPADAWTWAGIDPGKHGYVVVLLPGETALRAWSTPVNDDGDYLLPEVYKIACRMMTMGVDHVTLEAQQPTHMRPGQQMKGIVNSAVRASFMTGYGFAMWEVTLTAAGFRKLAKGEQAGGGTYDLAWPSHWKKKMGITVPKGFQGNRETEAKRLAREYATTQWPSHDFRASARARLPSADQCEAALIGLYGMSKHTVWGKNVIG
jgi:hypothetical protein